MKNTSFVRSLTISSLISLLCFIDLEAKGLPAKKAIQNDYSAYYQKVLKDLGEDWYIVYRIVDRISRANNLDSYLWRVILTREYDIQAYALDQSLVAIPKGLLDIAKAGDTSALACVIGHEMAHHTLEHKSKATASYTQLREELNRQTQAEIDRQEREKRVRDKTLQTLQNTSGFLGGVNKWLSAINSALPQPVYNDPNVIKKQAGDQLDTQYYALRQNQEYEADTEGFRYSVRAGFDKNGCIRVFDILSRTSQAKVYSERDSHPVVEDRKSRISSLGQSETIKELFQEGKRNISGKKPLGYELDRNSGWLRINTRFGTADSDFNKRFNDNN